MNNFVCFLVQMKTRKFAFEINWPLRSHSLWMHLCDWNNHFLVGANQCPTEIRYWYRKPKPIPNFSIGIGAVTSSAETETAIYWFFGHGKIEMIKPMNERMTETMTKSMPKSVTKISKQFRYRPKLSAN